MRQFSWIRWAVWWSIFVQLRGIFRSALCSWRGDANHRFNWSGRIFVDDYFDGFSGTSAAAPIVSGVVALMLEANPELDIETFKKFWLIPQPTRRVITGAAILQRMPMVAVLHLPMNMVSELSMLMRQCALQRHGIANLLSIIWLQSHQGFRMLTVLLGR